MSNSKAASCENNTELSQKARQNDDLIDDTIQTSLAGKILLNIPDAELKKKIGAGEDVSYQNINADALALALTERYTTSDIKVNIKATDLKEAKRVNNNGNILITFWDLKANSPYSQLCSAMKTKGANAKGF